MVIFSKTEKKKLYHNKQVRQHTFMMSTWKRDVQMGAAGGLKTFHMSAAADNKGSIVHFLGWRGWGVTKLVTFYGGHKCVTPNWFKITTNSIIGGSSFFFKIKPQAGYILNV